MLTSPLRKLVIKNTPKSVAPAPEPWVNRPPRSFWNNAPAGTVGTFTIPNIAKPIPLSGLKLILVPKEALPSVPPPLPKNGKSFRKPGAKKAWFISS